MKRSIQIITIFLILPIIGFSQNKFSLGANLNTEINSLKIIDSETEKGGIGVGYSIGIQAQYGLNEKTFLRSGINYQNDNYSYSRGALRWSSGDITPATQNDITIKSIGIPVDFGYTIKSKNQKINYFIGFGGLINLNLDDKTETQSIGEQDLHPFLSIREREINKSSYSIGAFIGIEIKFGENMILGIEPNFRYGSNIFTPLEFKSRLIESGFTIRIRMN